MKSWTARRVDEWWADLFDLDRSQLWQSVTATEHTSLGDYPGLFVAWRGDGIHASLPAACPTEVVSSMATRAVASLQDVAFWRGLAERLGLAVIGPSTHHYLDVAPGPAPGVVRVSTADVAALRADVSESEWQESGFGDDVALCFGKYDGDVLVAAANLTSFAGDPCDVGVLVARAARGRRLVDEVGRTAASHAIEHHGLARWRARTSNQGSLDAARRLDFEPWCTQLAVRPPIPQPA